MLPRYYLNDYFPLIDSPLLKEKEYMKTDIREYQNKYIMEIDLPGLKKEDIIINYENGYLTIKATKTVSLKVEAYIRRERFYGEVKRSFYIGEKKESDIKANYESGILTITFPKEDILKNLEKIPFSPRYLTHTYTKYTYPIQDALTREMILNLKNVLEKQGLYLLGRFAEWEYYNMDAAMGAAIDMFNSKLK